MVVFPVVSRAGSVALLTSGVGTLYRTLGGLRPDWRELLCPPDSVFFDRGRKNPEHVPQMRRQQTQVTVIFISVD